MAAVEQRAADGTPRAREPYQDDAGNWCCGACGRASGFRSKHAVLGHLRACRPGKPAVDALMADAGKPPAATGRSVYVPTQSEVTAVGLAAIPGASDVGAMMRKLDALFAMQQRLAVATGNHIQHLSSQNGTSASAKAKSPGIAWGKVVAATALGVVALSSLQRPAPAPVSSVPVDPRLARLCKRLADSGATLPDECNEAPPAPLAGVAASRKPFSLKGIVSAVKDAAALSTAVGKLV